MWLVILKNTKTEETMQIVEDVGIEMWKAANCATLCSTWAGRSKDIPKWWRMDIIVDKIWEIISPTEKELVYEG